MTYDIRIDCFVDGQGRRFVAEIITLPNGVQSVVPGRVLSPSLAPQPEAGG